MSGAARGSWLKRASCSTRWVTICRASHKSCVEVKSKAETKSPPKLLVIHARLDATEIQPDLTSWEVSRLDHSFLIWRVWHCLLVCSVARLFWCRLPTLLLSKQFPPLALPPIFLQQHLQFFSLLLRHLFLSRPLCLNRYPQVHLPLGLLVNVHSASIRLHLRKTSAPGRQVVKSPITTFSRSLWKLSSGAY